MPLEFAYWIAGTGAAVAAVNMLPQRLRKPALAVLAVAALAVSVAMLGSGGARA